MKIDHGQIMELDASAVASRVLMKGSAESKDHASSNAVRNREHIYIYLLNVFKQL